MWQKVGLFLLVLVVGAYAHDTTLDVMTYNIRHAKGTDEQINLDRIAAVVGKYDIVALQEVDGFMPRTWFQNQAKKLAEKLHMNYAYGRAGTKLWLFHYGNAVLSRYPIVSVKNHRLPQAGGMPRAMLQADLKIDGKIVHVFSAHLSLIANERALQIKAVISIVKKAAGRAILLGDFNARPYYPEISPLMTYMTDAFAAMGYGMGYSFRSTKPFTRIDYIFLRNEYFHIDWVFVKNTKSASGPHPSDHLPVVARLTMSN